MNFIEAANEALNWVGRHPVGDVLCAMGLTFLVMDLVEKYQEHQENRVAVDALMVVRPKIKPIKLPPLSFSLRSGQRS